MEKTCVGRFFHHVQLIFLNGLFTILPISLTVALVGFSFRLIKNWLEPLKPFLPEQLSVIPHAEIILGFIAIFVIGAILKFLVLRSLVHALEEVLMKIPLIRPVYSGIKQLTQAFSVQDTVAFKKVVVVEFPRKGLYSIGFLTSECTPELIPGNEGPYFNVFIPTTPNPTSGYFIVVPEKDIKVVNLNRQEAMALIISGGIIQPDRLTQ